MDILYLKRQIALKMANTTASCILIYITLYMTRFKRHCMFVQRHCNS